MERTKGWAQGVLYWGRVMVIGIVFGFGLQFAAAWTNPTLPAPDGNVAGPVNLSAFAQYKVGAIGFGGLVKAYLGIDANGQRITNVATPIAGTDAVNKDYVNAAAGGGGGGATGGTPFVIVASRHDGGFSKADYDKIVSFLERGGLVYGFGCITGTAGSHRTGFGWFGSESVLTPFQVQLDSPAVGSHNYSIQYQSVGGVKFTCIDFQDPAEHDHCNGASRCSHWSIYGIPFGS